ncbi:hemerythrin family protein [Treponema sp. HNW]|uniref:bacteriohemerythrin n=1 Tax=Treponema sp. HNW TaxID=3116654 RepID=UPI003D0D8326
MSEKDIFKWTDSLSVGFDEIDLHHKKLLLILNKFKETLELPEAEYKAQIGKIVKNLSDYTEYHFSEEEILMKANGCPGYEDHCKIHADFVAKIKQGLAPLVSGNKQTGAEFSTFLGDWLLDHIAVADHQWADYIHSKE